MPLFVNQSAVSERENSENPQREEEDGGEAGRGAGGGFNRGGGYLQLLQRIAELLRSAVPGGPRIASSYRGKTGEQTKDHVTRTLKHRHKRLGFFF